MAALLALPGPAAAQSDGCIEYYTPELVVDGRKVPYDLPQHRGAEPFEAAVGQTVAVDVQMIICPGDVFGHSADEASLEVVDEARRPALGRGLTFVPPAEGFSLPEVLARGFSWPSELAYGVGVHSRIVRLRADRPGRYLLRLCQGSVRSFAAPRENPPFTGACRTYFLDVGGSAAPPGGGDGPPAPAGEGCVTRADVVGRELWSPCLRRDGNRWRSRMWVRVAGLDYRPARGSEIVIGRDGRLRGRGRLTVRTTGALLPDGELELSSGRLNTDLAHQASLSLDGSRPVTFGGLPANAAAGIGVEWTRSGATLTASLDVGSDVMSLLDASEPVDGGKPTARNGYGLSAKLTTSNATGLVLDTISASVERATVFGAVALKSVSVAYKPQEKVWIGGATVQPFASGPLAKAAFGEWSGEVELSIDPVSLRRVRLEVRPINKPLGTTGIFLQSLGGELALRPALMLGGSIGVSFGPKVTVPLIGSDITAVEANGSASLTMGPWVAKGSGSMAILKQPVSDGSFTLDFTNGSASLAGFVDVSLLGNGFSGRVEGWATGASSFQVAGGVDVKVVGQGLTGGEGLISSLGIGACSRGISPDFGWRLRFSDPVPEIIFSSCDFGPIEVPRPGGRAAQALDGFTVPARQRGWAVRLGTPGGVVLRDPGGTAREIPAGSGLLRLPGVVALRDVAGGSLYLVLQAPRAGRWTVSPLPGQPPITALDQARALPEPGVRVSVGGADRRGRRTLRWRARAIRGQRLEFTEVGRDGLARRIAGTARARGRVRFRPAPGRRGVRRVRVLVSQSGAPRDAATVARFRVRAARPAAARALTVRRRGRRVVVRWRHAPGAVAYRVSLRLRDGRRLDRVQRRRGLVLRGVARRTRGRVRVSGVSATGLAGPARGARLR